MRRALLVLAVGLPVASCGGGATPTSSPLSTPRGPSMRSIPEARRDCPERYDDASAARASAETIAAATTLIESARADDRVALERALAPVTSSSAGELGSLLRSIPTTCTPVWYAQPGRFAVQPTLDGEPPDPSRDALADAIDAADHIVATCDGGCGVLALALAPDTRTVVASMAISQRPGNQH